MSIVTPSRRAAENGDGETIRGLFTQQRNDGSVLFRPLIEIATEAVLFVSLERKQKAVKKKNKNEEGAGKPVHGEEGHMTSSAPRTETDPLMTAQSMVNVRTRTTRI